MVSPIDSREVAIFISNVHGVGLDIVHARLCLEPQFEYITIQQLAHAPAFIAAHEEYFFAVDDPDEGATLAAWWDEIGYQRKRLIPEFEQDFRNCHIYLDLATVIRAAAYLKRGTGYEAAREEFQRSFIDSFIEGESIFFLSW